MEPMSVVMIHEHGEDSLKMLLIQNQQPVETFRAGGAHKPLGHGVRLRCAKRRPNDFNPVASKHLVKLIGEFLIPIANQKPDPFLAVRHGPCQLPSLLDDPWRARIRRAASEMHAAVAQFDEEQNV